MKKTNYSIKDNYIIVGVQDDNNKLLGFTVADRNGERVTSLLFNKASLAIEWCDNKCKGLLND